jgi:hypothetical protein
VQVSALTPGVDETAERSVDGVLFGGGHLYRMAEHLVIDRGIPTRPSRRSGAPIGSHRGIARQTWAMELRPPELNDACLDAVLIGGREECEVQMSTTTLLGPRCSRRTTRESRTSSVVRRAR